MIYYNIHTHQLAENPDERAIVSIDLRKNPLLKANNHYSAGIHPWYASRNMFELLNTISRQPNVVAIGEAGLDKLTNVSWELQKEIFLYQVKLAETLQKPLIIHCVKAWSELVSIYQSSRTKIPWIIHGFRGKGELARQLLHTGFYLSFGENYQSGALQEAWKSHRLFVETDDKDISIRTVYASVSNTLAISETTLSEEIRTNLQAWPSGAF